MGTWIALQVVLWWGLVGFGAAKRPKVFLSEKKAPATMGLHDSGEPLACKLFFGAGRRPVQRVPVLLSSKASEHMFTGIFSPGKDSGICVLDKRIFGQKVYFSYVYKKVCTRCTTQYLVCN